MTASAPQPVVNGPQRYSEHDPLGGFTVKKYVVYTITLYGNFLVNQISNLFQYVMKCLHIECKARWDWWNEILPAADGKGSLTLSGLPIILKICGKEIRNDCKTLKELGIDAVLSATERFENRSKGCFISAVSPEMWTNSNVEHCQIETEDFGTIEMEKVKRGVQFIHEQRSNGKNVDVHCKAGRGRSFLILLCYLIQHEKMAPQDALEFVQARRYQAKLEPAKWKTALDFAASLK